MEFRKLFVSTFLIVSVSGDVFNYDDEDHPILDMLLSDNYFPDERNKNEEVPKDSAQKPMLVDGVWLCGNCSDISEINLLYNESYEMETTNDEDMELQIGFLLDNMRCIKINTDEDAEVASVSGACSSNAVTLKVLNTSRCDFWIYS